MKHILFLSLCFITFAISSCKKEETCTKELGNPQATPAEITTLQTYLNANSITATAHSSGIFYQTITTGTGNDVKNQCAVVGVNYTGRLINGAQFDASTSTVSFPLSNLILGWRIGIPLMKVGGKIKLFVPPSLGYGNQTVGTIPPNSILVFDIELMSTN
jgi:FKBP-type peptidyl-prolyl cis-trans isomerase FkpA